MIRLELPLAPNLTNGRGHWRVRERQRDAYNLLCCGARVGVKRPPAPLPKARISATLYVWNPMDFDNLMARLKWTLDWLRADGWIADDSPRHLEWVGMPGQEIDRKRPRVVITLEAA